MATLWGNDNQQEQQWNPTNAGPTAFGGLWAVGGLAAVTTAMLYRKRMGMNFGTSHTFASNTMAMPNLESILSGLSRTTRAHPHVQPWELAQSTMERFSVGGTALAWKKSEYGKSSYVMGLKERSENLAQLISKGFEGLTLKDTNYLQGGINYYKHNVGNFSSQMPTMFTYQTLMNSQRLMNVPHLAFDTETSMFRGKEYLREFAMLNFKPSDDIRKLGVGNITSGVVINEAMLSRANTFSSIYGHRANLSSLEKARILRGSSQHELFDLASIAGFKKVGTDISYNPNRLLTDLAFEKPHSVKTNDLASAFDAVMRGSGIVSELNTALQKSKSIKLSNHFIATNEETARAMLQTTTTHFINSGGQLTAHNTAFDIRLMAKDKIQREYLMSHASDTLTIAEMHMGVMGRPLNAFSRSHEDLLPLYYIKDFNRHHEAKWDTLNNALLLQAQYEFGMAPPLLETINKDTLLLATGKYAELQKKTGIPHIDKLMDEHFMSAGNMYKLSDMKEIHDSLGATAYLVKLANINPHDMKTTRESYGIFSTREEVSELITRAFTTIGAQDHDAAKALADFKGANKGIEHLASAIGVNSIASSNRRIQRIRDVINTTDVKKFLKDVPEDSFHHYAQTASYIDALKVGNTNILNAYDKLKGTLLSKGKTDEEIEVIMGLAHKEAGTTIANLFKTKEINTTQFNRVLPLSQEFIEKFDLGTMSGINMSNWQMATKDINVILGKIRKGGSKTPQEETGATLLRELLGAHEYQDQLENLAMSGASPLGKILHNLNPKIIGNINANHKETFKALSKSSANAGELLAHILLNSGELQASLPSKMKQFIPSVDPGQWTKFETSAKNIADRMININNEDDLFKLIGHHLTGNKVTGATPQGYTDIYNMTESQGKNVAKSIWELYSNIRSKVGTNGRVVMRTIDEGRQVHIGIMSNASNTSLAKFYQGEAHITGYNGEDMLHNIFIPIGQAEKMQIGNRTFHGKTILRPASGSARDISVLGKTYERLIPAEKIVESYNTTEFMNQLDKDMGHVFNEIKAYNDIKLKGNQFDIDKAFNKVQIAQDSIQKSINHIQNANIELYSATNDTQWLLNQGINQAQVDSMFNIQSGTLGDMLAGSKIKFQGFEQIYQKDYKGKLTEDLKMGMNLIHGMKDMISPFAGSEIYTRATDLVKGQIAGFDLPSLFVGGHEMNPASPRMFQSTNHLNVKQLSGTKSDAFATTTAMESLMAEGRRITNDQDIKHFMPIIGAEVKLGSATQLRDIIGHDLPGLSLNEGAILMRASTAQKYMGYRDTEVNVGEYIANTLYPEVKVGQKIGHGTVLGSGANNEVISYKHSLQVSPELMSSSLKEIGMNLTPEQLSTEVMGITNIAGGGKRFHLRERVPVLPGQSGYGNFGKGTFQILADDLFNKVAGALGMPEAVEFLTESNTMSKSSRLNLGAMIDAYSNRAISVLRDNDLAAHMAGQRGIGVDTLRREAEQTLKLFDVDISQPSGHGSLAHPRGVARHGTSIEDLKNRLVTAENLSINKFVEHGGGMHNIIGSNVFLANEPFFARVSGADWQGTRMGWREIEAQLIQGKTHMAEEFMRDLDQTRNDVALSTMKAIMSIGNTLKDTVHALPATPIEKLPGGAYSHKGTLFELLGNEGAYVKLPVTARVNLGDLGIHTKESAWKDVDKVFIPALNPYVTDKGLRDRYASQLHTLTNIAPGDVEETNKWMAHWINTLKEDGLNKNSAIMKALSGYQDMSAIARTAPGGRIGTPELTLHPTRIQDIMGEHGLELLQHFEDQNKPLLMYEHRFPSTTLTSGGPVKLTQDPKAMPWLHYVEQTDWKARQGDHDGDLAAILLKLGIDKKKWSDYGDAMASTQDPTTRKSLTAQMYSDITSSPLYAEQHAAWVERTKLIKQNTADTFKDVIYSGDLVKENENRLSSLLGEGKVQGYLEHARELFADQATHDKYLSHTLEMSMGTKALVGTVSNLGDALKQMNFMVHGLSPKQVDKEQALLAFAGAGAIYDFATATKGTELPYEHFMDFMKAGEHSNVAELETNFIKRMKDEGHWDKFTASIGSLFVLGKDETPISKGSESVHAVFEMIGSYSKTYNEGKYMSAQAFKDTAGITSLLNSNSLGSSMSLLDFHNIYNNGTGTEGISDIFVRAMRNKIEVEGVAPGVKAAKQEVSKVVLDTARSNMRGTLKGAALIAGMIAIPYIAGKALQSTPPKPTSISPPPIQEPGYYDKMYGQPGVSYESTYVNVKAKSNKPTREIDKVTMMALQNSMQTPLSGNINVNDNRKSPEDIVTHALVRMI